MSETLPRFPAGLFFGLLAPLNLPFDGFAEASADLVFRIDCAAGLLRRGRVGLPAGTGSSPSFVANSAKTTSKPAASTGRHTLGCKRPAQTKAPPERERG